jgi:hypothetical protein
VRAEPTRRTLNTVLLKCYWNPASDHLSVSPGQWRMCSYKAHVSYLVRSRLASTPQHDALRQHFRLQARAFLAPTAPVIVIDQRRTRHSPEGPRRFLSILAANLWTQELILNNSSRAVADRNRAGTKNSASSPADAQEDVGLGPCQVRDSTTESATARSCGPRKDISGARGSFTSRSRPLQRSHLYGLIWEMRVAQLPRLARVPPQVPNGAALYSAKVQVWAMYSDAVQMVSPSTAAAP